MRLESEFRSSKLSKAILPHRMNAVERATHHYHHLSSTPADRDVELLLSPTV